MNLDLHIGTPKTGTTSIQKFLENNKNALSKQGILYPSTLRLFPNSSNHRIFSWIGIDKVRFKKELIIYKKHNKNFFGEDSNIISLELKKFEEELKLSKKNKCIISSEHITSYGLNNVEKFKKITDKFFNKTRIIVYIRNPIDRIFSGLNTKIRCGKAFEKIKYPPLINKKLIKEWSEIYGEENIVVRLFNKNDLIENDLIADFCAQTKISLNNNFVYPNKENESLNFYQLKYLNYINSKVPRFVDNKINPNSVNVALFVKNNFQSPVRYLPTKEEYHDVENKSFEENEWIRRKYFPDKSYLWSKYEKGFRKNKNELFDFSEEELILLKAIVLLFNKDCIKSGKLNN